MMQRIASGKIRDFYDVGEYILMVTTDRMSVCDVILNESVPKTGIVLNKISEFWFDFTKDIIPNHMVSTTSSDFPEEFRTDEFKGRSMLVKKLMMLPIECIVRGYISGEGWELYRETGEICGVELPQRLVEFEKLPEPIYTPSTKGDHEKDILISFDETVSLIGKERALEIRDKSLELYSKCAQHALSKGIIIADTKFEFGIDENDNLVLADEIFTPDSSRFWSANKYQSGKAPESFDSEFLEKRLVELGWNKTPPPPELPQKIIDAITQKYIEVFELLTDKEFQ